MTDASLTNFSLWPPLPNSAQQLIAPTTRDRTPLLSPSYAAVVITTPSQTSELISWRQTQTNAATPEDYLERIYDLIILWYNSGGEETIEGYQNVVRSLPLAMARQVLIGAFPYMGPRTSAICERATSASDVYNFWEHLRQIVDLHTGRLWDTCQDALLCETARDAVIADFLSESDLGHTGQQSNLVRTTSVTAGFFDSLENLVYPNSDDCPVSQLSCDNTEDLYLSSGFRYFIHL